MSYINISIREPVVAGMSSDLSQKTYDGGCGVSYGLEDITTKEGVTPQNVAVFLAFFQQFIGVEVKILL